MELRKGKKLMCDYDDDNSKPKKAYVKFVQNVAKKAWMVPVTTTGQVSDHTLKPREAQIEVVVCSCHSRVSQPLEAAEPRW